MALDKKFQQAFVIFDTDGDGEITSYQATHALQSCGFIMRKEDIAKVPETLTLEKFSDLVAVFQKGKSPESELKNLFKAFDRGGNGKLNSKELSQVMATLGDQLSEEEVKQMITDLDPNNTGQVDYIKLILSLTE
ncbi:putative calmodulin [Cardiosporidium cionae]|uniref:Calmodulin n=1 Tax=Cardiosporidium cionae TaxID=476202 RepID=A0ABQ7JBN0_9APIC|nr:putative calmodulin [Cardiosporidium cionae]|eukprot:KAF8821408.1 putative calmodulin [Cardiosporidium cionae]